MNTRVHDPIAHALSLYFIRSLNFLGWSLVLLIVLWLGLLTGWFDYPLDEQWAITRLALTNANPWVSTVFWLCVSVSVLLTTVAYLAIALWWRQRGGDLHHRGARFIDQRDARD